jgi:serine-threonine kinase receptor-associated protein
MFLSMFSNVFQSLTIAKIWDAVSGDEKCNFQHNHIVKSVAFDEESLHLLTGSNEKILRVFDLNQASTSPALENYEGHAGAIKRAYFCRNDKCIVSCAEDKAVRIWDRSSGSEVHHIEFKANPGSIEISHDGSILTIANGNNISFFEMDTFRMIKEIVVPTKVADASVHPDKLSEFGWFFSNCFLKYFLNFFQCFDDQN